MQLGDLVFVHSGAQSQYVYTVPGSWGYVSRQPDPSWNRLYVRFKHFGEGSHGYTYPDKGHEYDILREHLCTLPEPPETHEEITTLVTALAKLVREEQSDGKQA